MKFLHIADVHLGANPKSGKAYSENRGKEIWNSFSQVIEVCEKESVDLLLIAGDLFHRQPLLRELKEVNYLFSTLTKTQVVLIAGNHDYIKRDSYYRTFEWSENVRPLLGEKMGIVELPELETCVYGFSYYRKEIPEPLYEEVHPAGKEKYEILLAHGGDERCIPIKKNKLAALGFSYVALGHIHKPEELVKNSVAYAGALEPLDKNETGRHGYILGEINERGTRITFVPQAKREYVHLEIEVNENMTALSLKETVKTTLEQCGVQNLYQLILKGFRDPDILFDPDILDMYGNVLEVLDESYPAYHFEKLKAQNEDNLLGRYIESFDQTQLGSLEKQALYEGVQALLMTKRG
ncbi:MAG: DNA repair exonuclease [Lachnospiraceae bacterium]